GGRDRSNAGQVYLRAHQGRQPTSGAAAGGSPPDGGLGASVTGGRHHLRRALDPVFERAGNAAGEPDRGVVGDPGGPGGNGDPSPRGAGKPRGETTFTSRHRDGSESGTLGRHSGGAGAAGVSSNPLHGGPPAGLRA